MTKKFRYIPDTEYPDVENVDVFGYPVGSFDFRQWGAETKINLLRVCWDSDYSNVVKFASDEERDAYIDNQTTETHKLESEQWLLADGTIRLPIPFDVALKSNYIAVDYPTPPVEYADENRINRILYFVKNVKKIAPSTTEFTLEIDYWTTFINSTEIAYMLLQRGHAPMQAAATPAKFLSNPIDNAWALTTPDVNYENSGERVKIAGQYIFNDGEMYCVFITSADADSADWGTFKTDSMRIPGIIVDTRTGAYNFDMIAIPVSDLGPFMLDVATQAPYWRDAVQCMLYISSKMLVFDSTFSFLGHTVSKVRGNSIKTNLTDLSIDTFNYADQYKKITKLYTSPYAYIDVSDESGNRSQIRIEELGAGGQIGLQAALNLMIPGACINAHLLNVGESQTAIAGFAQSAGLSTTIGGRWSETLRTWSIPQYALIDDQQNRQIWERYWQNKQAEVAYNNSYDSAIASNATTYNNTIASNATANSNALLSADTSYLISAAQAQAAMQDNTTNNSTNVQSVKISNDMLDKGNSYNAMASRISMAQANWLTTKTFNVNKNNAVASFAAGTVGAVGGGALLGAGAGPGGAVIGAAGGLGGALGAGIGAIISQATSEAEAQNSVLANNAGFNLQYGNTDISIGLKDNIIDEYSRWNGQVDPTSLSATWVSAQKTNAGANASNMSGSMLAHAQNSYNMTLGGKSRTWTGSTVTDGAYEWEGTAVASKRTSVTNANLSKNAADANATRSKNTADANALRSKNTAISAVNTGQAGATLQAPAIHGSFANNSTALTRPEGLFATLHLQSDNAIMMAGDQMLRYGYTYGGNWKISDLQVMKYFTYWQAEDLWLTCNRPGIDDAEDTIRAILQNGVTVWNDPTKIGKVSIYDNWK